MCVHVHACVCAACGAHRALGRVDLVQQSHDFFAEAERPGVAGRRGAARQPEKAAESQQSGGRHGAAAQGPADGSQRAGCGGGRGGVDEEGAQKKKKTTHGR